MNEIRTPKITHLTHNDNFASILDQNKDGSNSFEDNLKKEVC